MDQGRFFRMAFKSPFQMLGLAYCACQGFSSARKRLCCTGCSVGWTASL